MRQVKKFFAALFILAALFVNVSLAEELVDYDYDDAQEALNYISQFVKVSPDIAIITGSGLGTVAYIVENQIIIDTHDIPNWPISRAPGTKGE